MFNKYGKKALSLAMATAMAASMALPTFAANETSINAAYQEIEIAVTVPDTGTVIINPYGLPVDVEGYDDVQISNEKITTQPLYITNNGKIDLSVGAKVTTTNGKSSGIAFVTKLGTDKTKKEVLLKLQMAQSAQSGAIDDKATQAIVEEFATASTWTATDVKTTAMDATGGGTVADKDKVVLVGLTEGKNGDDEYDEGSVVLFRLSGDVQQDAEWTTKDSFTTNIAFTFVPYIAPVT
jgi:hypothetical protein